METAVLPFDTASAVSAIPASTESTAYETSGVGISLLAAGEAHYSPSSREVQSPPWLQRAEHTLQRFLTFQERWDSYQARRIDPHVIDTVRQLIRRYMRRDTPEAQLVPTNRGGVQLEWHTQGIDLEIDVISPGHLHLFYSNTTNHEESELDIDAPFMDLEAYITPLSPR